MSKRKKGNDDDGGEQDVKYGIQDMTGVVINAEAGENLSENFRKATTKFSVADFINQMSLDDLDSMSKVMGEKRKHFRTDYVIKMIAMKTEQMKLLEKYALFLRVCKIFHNSTGTEKQRVSTTLVEIFRNFNGAVKQGVFALPQL